jgi:hypothetical protein
MGPTPDADRPLRVGDVLVYERTLEEADIRTFGALTGDQGAHHLAAPDRLPIAQGLLVASVPTKLAATCPSSGARCICRSVDSQLATVI